MSLNRPEMYRFHNGGKKDTLPFADPEYHDRLAGLRDILTHIKNHPDADRIWFTRPGDIYDHIAALPKGTVPGDDFD